ncbi:MAG: pyridoxal-dependent decarboxylase [Bacteroidia bacterium]|nr:pyridoxal-dependent decarboxylase [Bacteroidia bacterium]
MEQFQLSGTLTGLHHSLEKAYQPEEFRRVGHQLIDLISDQLSQASRKEIPVIPYRSPEDELNFWKDDFEKNQGGEPIELFQKILDHSSKVHHPHIMGHQIATPALLSSFGGLISDILANGTGVYEMGMASNGLEKLVTDFLAQAIGYGLDGGGFLTSGGTLANLTAMLAARKAKAKGNVWTEGHSQRLAIMVSEEAHYCIDRAARIMGMGSQGIIKVPVDDKYKIRIDLLEEYYQRAKAEGLQVIALIGCASSTATGSYDDLDALGDFSHKHDLWYHIDGAHGGGVILSEKYKYLAKGIEKADSVVIDFHKMLMTPALNTALIFRRGEDAYKTFQQRAQYLWDQQQTEEWYNSGKRTFECTKLMMSIRVYTILRTYGPQIFGENIEKLHGMAENFAQILKARKDFELAHEPESNIINYRYILAEENKLDALNTKIRERLIHEGDYYIVSTSLQGKKYLRSAIMNPLTTEEDFTALLDKIAFLARNI